MIIKDLYSVIILWLLFISYTNNKVLQRIEKKLEPKPTIYLLEEKYKGNLNESLTKNKDY